MTDKKDDSAPVTDAEIAKMHEGLLRAAEKCAALPDIGLGHIAYLTSRFWLTAKTGRSSHNEIYRFHHRECVGWLKNIVASDKQVREHVRSCSHCRVSICADLVLMGRDFVENFPDTPIDPVMMTKVALDVLDNSEGESK